MQQRSCGWNDRRDNHVNSIWSGEYKFGPTEDPAPPKVHLPEKPITKGTEKIISVKGLKLAGKELLAKRPRSGMFILNKYMNYSRRLWEKKGFYLLFYGLRLSRVNSCMLLCVFSFQQATRLTSHNFKT